MPIVRINRKSLGPIHEFATPVLFTRRIGTSVRSRVLLQYLKGAKGTQAAKRLRPTTPSPSAADVDRATNSHSRRCGDWIADERFPADNS